MTLSGFCARSIRFATGEEALDSPHVDCSGSWRYFDHDTGDYISGVCTWSCHVEKRKWYSSDFGPGRPFICRVGNLRPSATVAQVQL